MRRCPSLFSASAALAALLLSPATGARADDTLRKAYAEGFWDGFAMAETQLSVRSRNGGGSFALSLAGETAPIWIAPAGASAPAAIAMPMLFDSEPGMALIHFKGPWLWFDPDATEHLSDGLLERGEFGASAELAEAASLDPTAAEAIRRMRSMGINEGAVLVRVAPTQ